MTQLSVAWADRSDEIFALAIRRDDGRVVAAAPAAVRSGEYPMARPLLLVTDGPPRGDARRLVDFLLSPRGQALVAEHGYLPIAPAADRGDRP
jgi:phosphate transport system substrate-binding protein